MVASAGGQAQSGRFQALPSCGPSNQVFAHVAFREGALPEGKCEAAMARMLPKPRGLGRGGMKDWGWRSRGNVTDQVSHLKTT